MTIIWVTLVIALGSLTQSVTGFGLALVAVPLLVNFIPLLQATAIISLVSVVTNIYMSWRNRRSVYLGSVGRLALASICTIPLGLIAVTILPQRILLQIMGGILLGFTLYSLLKLSLPRLKSSLWDYGFGAVSGFLSGAYNMGGPPVILYAQCKGWTPEEYRSNLPGFFGLGLVSLLIGQGIQGRFTDEVLTLFVLALPGMMTGLLVGERLTLSISVEWFSRIVLLGLTIIGIRLLMTHS